MSPGVWEIALNFKSRWASFRDSLAGLRFWIGVFTMGIVLAISWGLYFVVTLAVGFDLGLTLGFLAVTILMVGGFAAMELLVRRRRARTSQDIGV